MAARFLIEKIFSVQKSGLGDAFSEEVKKKT